MESSSEGLLIIMSELLSSGGSGSNGGSLYSSSLSLLGPTIELLLCSSSNRLEVSSSCCN